MKTIVLPSKRSTFTFGLIGFDLSKLKEVKKADIIHIHWLKDGFINFKTILLADFGPSPGNLEISFINSSISFIFCIS